MTFKCPHCAREHDHRMIDASRANSAAILNGTRMPVVCGNCERTMHVTLVVTSADNQDLSRDDEDLAAWGVLAAMAKTTIEPCAADSSVAQFGLSLFKPLSRLISRAHDLVSRRGALLRGRYPGIAKLTEEDREWLANSPFTLPEIAAFRISSAWDGHSMPTWDDDFFRSELKLDPPPEDSDIFYLLSMHSDAFLAEVHWIAERVSQTIEEKL